MQSLIEAYMAKLQERGPMTVRCFKPWLQNFGRYCQQSQLSLANLQATDLTAFEEHLLWTPGERGLRASGTVQQAIYKVRQFLRWCLAQGHLATDITQNWRSGKCQSRPLCLLTRPHIEAILQSPDPNTPLGLRDLAILRTTCELGLYGHACHRLDLADLDLAARRLGRQVLSPQLEESLHRYLLKGRPALLTDPTQPALFLSWKGKRLKPQIASQILDYYGHRVSPRLLHKSWLAHHEALISRRFANF